ncbi:MAG: hypothetical protein MUE54_07620 [Anaerolineae bacterium]|jgi:predicted transcriptional regulator|nr:hypothetical protein [Anaerolineae bacterium]
MTSITIELPDDVIQKLQARADSQQVALNEYIQSALTETIDDDEPTKEDVLNAIREGILSVMKGDFGRPAHEVLDELEDEVTDYAK